MLEKFGANVLGWRLLKKVPICACPAFDRRGMSLRVRYDTWVIFSVAANTMMCDVQCFAV